MKRILLLNIFMLSSIFIFSQANSGKPNIFLDCQMRCYFQYVREEITFVNYLQDRQEAEIYILATRQRTGAGGREIRLEFIGSGAYIGVSDTLTYIQDPDATEVIARELLVKNLKKGLLPYLLLSPVANQINYEVAPSENEDEVSETIKDPWSYWVFNIGGNANFNSEASFSGTNLTGRFSGSRITDQHKLTFSFRYNYEKSKFVLTDGEEFISILKRNNSRFLYVKSLTDHWSVGGRAGGGSSTFGNTDFDAFIKPSIEYNIFPYQESSTKRFSFLYSIGPEYKNYTDTTVFNKTKETVFRHGVSMEFEQTQKWGNIEIDMGFNQYLHDVNLFSFFFNPNLEWIITKGLRINCGGFISFVGDRINIAKADISDEDILLQLKQLDTEYTFFTYLGVNYRFGSKYNNFINPRF